MHKLLIEYPEELLVSVKETEEQFNKGFLIAGAIKLYEMGKISSGMAARLSNMDKVTFIKKLGEYKVSITSLEELMEDDKFEI